MNHYQLRQRRSGQSDFDSRLNKDHDTFIIQHKIFRANTLILYNRIER